MCRSYAHPMPAWTAARLLMMGSGCRVLNHATAIGLSTAICFWLFHVIASMRHLSNTQCLCYFHGLLQPVSARSLAWNSSVTLIWWFRPGPRMKHAQCEISGRDSALCLCKEWSLVEEVDRKKVFPSEFWCFSGSWNVVRLRAKATKLMMISKISVCDIGNTPQPPPTACIITAPEDQRRPRGLQWGTLFAKMLRMLDWFAQASICQPGIIEFEKATWEAFQSQDFGQIGWEDQDACLKMGVSKSPLCCSFPPCIPKIPKLSLFASHGTEECSASFQLCVGLCLRRLLNQCGRSPSLIFCLEISACSGCKLLCLDLERCPASLHHPKPA